MFDDLESTRKLTKEEKELAAAAKKAVKVAKEAARKLTKEEKDLAKAAKETAKVMTKAAKEAANAHKKLTEDTIRNSFIQKGKLKKDFNEIVLARKIAEEQAVAAYKIGDLAAYASHMKRMSFLDTLEKRHKLQSKKEGTIIQRMFPPKDAITIEEMGGKLKQWYGVVIGAAAMAKVWSRDLSLADRSLKYVQATQDLSNVSFSRSVEVSNQFQKAFVGNSAMANKFGTTEEELNGVMTNISYQLRTQNIDLKNLSPTYKSLTSDIYQFARAQNIEVSEAMDMFSSEIHNYNRSMTDALDTMTDVQIGQSNFQKTMEKSGLVTKHTSAINKEDYYKVFKDSRSIMGNVMTDTRSLTGIIEQVGMSAIKSGSSYTDMVAVMTDSTKILHEIPKFFKVKMGSGFLKQFDDNRKDFISKLGGSDKEREGISRRMEDILKLAAGGDIPPWKAAMWAQNALSGTTAGIKATLSTWGSMSKAQRYGLMEGIIGEDKFMSEGPALIDMINKGPAGVDAAASKISKIQSEAKAEREKYSKAQKDYFKNQNEGLIVQQQLVKELQEVKSKIFDWIASSDLVTAAIHANTLVQGVKAGIGVVRSGLGAVSSALGGGGVAAIAKTTLGTIATTGVAGVAGMAVAVLGTAAVAGAIAYYVQDYFKVDEYISDKLMERWHPKTESSIAAEKANLNAAHFQAIEMAKRFGDIKAGGKKSIEVDGKERAITEGFVKERVNFYLSKDKMISESENKDIILKNALAEYRSRGGDNAGIKAPRLALLPPSAPVEYASSAMGGGGGGIMFGGEQNLNGGTTVTTDTVTGDTVIKFPQKIVIPANALSKAVAVSSSKVNPNSKNSKKTGGK